MKKQYRQSDLVNYFSCPKKFLFSQKVPFEKTNAMREGHLFEGLVFGFKENHFAEFDLPIDQDPLDNPAKKFKVTEETMTSYKVGAEVVKKIFTDGQAYVELSVSNEKWTLRGEADWLGNGIYLGQDTRALWDLKFTGDIERNWGNKESRIEEFFQSVVYPYLHWKNTGEILPFIYVLVENQKKIPEGVSPFIKTMGYQPTIEDFAKLEKFIDMVDADFEFEPNQNACIGGQWNHIECRYIMHCQYGRYLKEIPVLIPSLEWPLEVAG